MYSLARFMLPWQGRADSKCPSLLGLRKKPFFPEGSSTQIRRYKAAKDIMGIYIYIHIYKYMCVYIHLYMESHTFRFGYLDPLGLIILTMDTRRPQRSAVLQADSETARRSFLSMLQQIYKDGKGLLERRYKEATPDAIQQS